jgi:glycosyltransferase involved in cell wall biosynthesis
VAATIVSVIVPTLNSARTLEACLASVRAQTHRDLELIVVDNSSSDGTAAVGERLADVFLAGSVERATQRNDGARAAQGSALVFVDSDMVLEPTVVAECAESLEGGADAVVIPERSFGEGFWAQCKALERSCYVGDPTIEASRCFRRQVFDQVGGYDESMIAGEDWDLHERVRLSGAPIGRTAAFIWHDEGSLKLRNTAAKKFRYGQTLGIYIDRHPARARRQLRLIRPAFVRHRRRLARDPVRTAGMIAMKASEAAAGAAGLVVAKLR